MAVWWLKTIGMLICLGFLAGVFVHFLRGALHLEDSTRIDKHPDNVPSNES